jgi:hypothetical protein
MQQGGVYGGLNIGNDLMSSLNKSMSAPTNTQSIYASMMGGQGNDYLDAMKGSLSADAARAQALNSGTIDAQAAAAGMSGGSRHGVAQALGKEASNRALTGQMAQMGYNTFDQDLQNKLRIAEQADTNTFNRQQLMSGMLGQQQGAVQQGIGNTAGVQGYGMNQFNVANQPYQGLQAYQGAIGGPSILNRGTSQNQGSGTSSGWSMGQNSGGSKGGGIL